MERLLRADVFELRYKDLDWAVDRLDTLAREEALVEQVLESGPASRRESGVSAWKSPAGWLLEKQLSRSFWVFFAVAFFFDFGFSVYFFLFNLYLLDFHFNERIIGFVGGALTLGSVVGTCE